MKNEWYDYWFDCVKGIGPARKKYLKRKSGNIELIYNIEESDCELKSLLSLTEQEFELIRASKAGRNWKNEYTKINERGIRFISFDSVDYPVKLTEHSGMPYGLYVKGKMPGNEKNIAIVGARRCSTYGESVTLKIAESLAEVGVGIISGMALGIDGAAHRGALNVNGNTYAVLGCGVDICYPRLHTGLYRDLEENGGIISEYPPGTPPLAVHFPNRNRIISALSDAVLVMEAEEKSGSLITADFALEQGKDVFALPGMIDSRLSKGCNQLIRQGAGIISGITEIMQDLEVFDQKRQENRKEMNKHEKIKLETKELMVYGSLCLYPKSKQEIISATGMEPEIVSALLVALELKGYITEISKNYYIRKN